MKRCAALVLALAALCGAEDGTAPTPAVRATIDGEVLHAGTLTFLGVELHDVSTIPGLADDVLTFADCSASCYGGKVTARIAFDLRRKVQTYRIDVADVDLGTLVARLGGGDGTDGRLSGWIELTIPPEGLDAMEGRGEVRVQQGELLRLGALSSLLIGDPMGAPRSDEAVARLIVHRGRIQLKGAAVRSPGAVLKLRGTVGLDGTLDLVAIPYPEFAWLQILPGLGDAAAWLLSTTSSRLARATIRGTLSEPAIVVNPFAD